MSLISSACLQSSVVLSSLIVPADDGTHGVLLSRVGDALRSEAMHVRARGVLGLIETLSACITHGHASQAKHVQAALPQRDSKRTAEAMGEEDLHEIEMREMVEDEEITDDEYMGNARHR